MPLVAPIPQPSQTPMAVHLLGLGSVIPNAMLLASPSFGTLTGALPRIVEFDGPGPYAGLLYPMGLHLFEARKSLDRRPGVARRIWQCSRVEEVTAISGELRTFTRPDWANVAPVIVSNVFFFVIFFFG